jgi:hypothetical protein
VLDWLRDCFDRAEPGQVPLVRFHTPRSIEDHERIAHDIAALARFTVHVTERGDDVAVTFTRHRRKRTIVHPRGTFDLDRTIRALELLLEGDVPRRYYRIERASLTEDFAIAFATDLEILHLIECGWIVVNDPDEPREIHVVEGLRVRGPILRWDDGSLKRVQLAEDVCVYGLSCAAGTPLRFVEGRVCDVTLGAPAVLPDCTLPPGTRAFFHYRSQVIGLAKLGASVEIAGLVLPAGSDLELDEDARLIGAVLAAEASAPSGYRDRGVLAAETALSFRDGRWELVDPDRARPLRPRRWRTHDRPALRGWSLLALVIAVPTAIFGAMAARLYLQQHDHAEDSYRAPP